MADKSKAGPDFAYWSKKAYWTLDEGIALSFGREPEQTNWRDIQKFTKKNAFAAKYAKVRDLALRAVAAKHIRKSPVPGAFLVWLGDNEIEYPEELGKQVEARGYKDWRHLYDELQTATDKKIEGLKAEIVEITQERLNETNQKLKPRSPTAEAKETDSQLKMIIGMAIEQYGYIPDQSRSSVTGHIETDLITNGVPLNGDTILKHLRAATELLPDEIRKDLLKYTWR